MSRLVVTRYVYAIPGAAGRARLVFLSDLHSRRFGRENARLVALVAAQEPDLICLPGDLMSRTGGERDVAALCALIARLAALAPVYLSLGNHERCFRRDHGDGFLRRLAAAGATVLDESYRDVAVNGLALRLGGLSRSALEPAAQTADFLRRFTDTDVCRVLLCHKPESFRFRGRQAAWDVELLLCGHTHGGLARPFGLDLYAPKQGFFPELCYGRYELGGATMLISSGLAPAGVVPRLFNPPEICVAELAGVEKTLSEA